VNPFAVPREWDRRGLPANVLAGDECWLEGKDSFVRFRSQREPGLVLGRRVRVYGWTIFNVEPNGCIEVGDDSILVGAVCMCAASIKIGAGVLVSYNVTLADCDFHPLEAEARRRDALAIAPGGDLSSRPSLLTSPVSIEDEAWIGIGAIVLKGVTIGKRARIGAGAVVTSDVAPGEFVRGNPALPLGAGGRG